MKSSTIYYFSSVILLGMAGAAVCDDTQVSQNATSVAEMLHLRQEHQLREQLVEAGNWDEVHKLDAADAIHAHAQRERLYIELNEQLSSKHVDKVLANQCDSEEITSPKPASHHAESIVSNEGQ